MNTEAKRRPYWHVDLKWVTGIFATVFLGASLWLFSVYRLTSHDVAVPTAAYSLASLASPNGIDSPDGIKQMKDAAEKSKSKTYAPISFMPGATVSLDELNTLSPRQVRLKFYTRVFEPYYNDGADAVAQNITSDPKVQKNIINQVGLLVFVNQKNNSLVLAMLKTTIVLAILFMTGVIIFSMRFGRLISPGVILTIVSLGQAIGLTIFLNNSIVTGEVVGDILHNLASQIAGIYQTTAVIGVSLIIIGLIGEMIYRYTNRFLDHD